MTGHDLATLISLASAQDRAWRADPDGRRPETWLATAARYEAEADDIRAHGDGPDEARDRAVAWWATRAEYYRKQAAARRATTPSTVTLDLSHEPETKEDP